MCAGRRDLMVLVIKKASASGGRYHPDPLNDFRFSGNSSLAHIQV